MSKLEQVLAEKGIKNDVPFMVGDNKMILHNGKVYTYSLLFKDYFVTDSDKVLDIVLGNVEVKQVEFPEYGDIYYTPDFYNGAKAHYWRGSDEDKFYKENKLLYKDKDKATEMAKYITEASKKLGTREEE